MKYITLFLTLVFLSGCSGMTELSLDDFLPAIEEFIIEQNSSSIDEEFSYISINFPQNCDWKPLKRVVDGDTIIVDRDLRVRFIGIDTPETKREGYPVQPYGLEASAKMKELLKDTKRVCLIEDSIGDKYDQYSRKLAYVFTEDGVDTNGAMLKSGLARGYFRFPFDRKAEFRSYEREAKDLKVGIWE